MMIAQIFKYFMLAYELKLFRGMSQFFKTGLIICTVFIVISILLIAILFFQRYQKNKFNKHKNQLENASIDFLTTFLFDDEMNKKKELRTFRKKLIKDHDKQIVTQQILEFANNIKGESVDDIKDLFEDLRLDIFNLRQLQSPRWEKKARALYVFSELSYPIDLSEIINLINHKRVEVRQQCLLYILKAAKNNPLEFLDRLERPLTKWQEIYIENSLKSDYQGTIPDFSQWLNHRLESVVIFAIRMTSEFNQFENIPKIKNLISTENIAVRKEAIQCLNKMGDDAVITELIETFKGESPEVQIEILNLIKNNGNYDQFLSLLTPIIKAHDAVKVAYFNINRTHFQDESEDAGDIVKFALNDSLLPLFGI